MPSKKHKITRSSFKQIRIEKYVTPLANSILRIGVVFGQPTIWIIFAGTTPDNFPRKKVTRVASWSHRSSLASHPLWARNLCIQSRSRLDVGIFFPRLRVFYWTSCLFSTWILSCSFSLHSQVQFSSLSTSYLIFSTSNFRYFDRLFGIFDLVFIQLDWFTLFGRMFVFSTSYFIMWIFCP